MAGHLEASRQAGEVNAPDVTVTQEVRPRGVNLGVWKGSDQACGHRLEVA